MAKYIDADALIADLQDRYKSYSWDDEPEQKQEVAHWVSWIDNLDAADVRENVRGEWIKIVDQYDNVISVQCSACFEDFDYIDGVYYLCHGYELPLFCPNCGADNRPETTSADMRG